MMEKTIHASDLIALLAKHRISRTVRWLGQVAEKGFYPKAQRGNYEAMPTILGLLEYFHGVAEKGNDAEQKERALRAKVKRKIEQEQLAIIKRKYVARVEISQALRSLALHQRATLVRKLESELASRLPPEYHPLLANSVEEICSDFHNGVRAWLEADTEPPMKPSVKIATNNERNT